MSWFQTLLPVITLIAGGVLQHLSQWGADARQRKAAREARNSERIELREDRRENFELDHLLRLHNALSSFAPAVADAHNNIMATLQSGNGPSVRPDVDRRFVDTSEQVFALMDLVLDDELRGKVRAACSAMMRTRVDTTTPEVAAKAFSDAVGAYRLASAALAERLRQIYLDQG